MKHPRKREFIDWDGIAPAEGHYYLYGLYDPKDNDIYRYIGITAKPEDRYGMHQHQRFGNRCTSGRCDDAACHAKRGVHDPFAEWWKAIRARGDRPRMRVFADVGTDSTVAQKCERAVIAMMLGDGGRLFNRRTYLETGKVREIARESDLATA